MHTQSQHHSTVQKEEEKADNPRALKEGEFNRGMKKKKYKLAVTTHNPQRKTRYLQNSILLYHHDNGAYTFIKWVKYNLGKLGKCITADN